MTDRKPRPNRLREYRDAAGLTQQELADLVGAGRVTIVRAEQGSQAPSLELADRLADELDTTIDELFSGSDRAGYDDGLRDGRLAEREREDRGTRGDPGDRGRVEPDTPLDQGTAEIAAWIAESISAKPSAPDHKSVWHLNNPRGTRRKLDAVVLVEVARCPPRKAKRLYDQILTDWRVEGDTDGDG